MSITTVPETPVQPANVRLARSRVLRQIGRLAYAIDSIALPSPAAVRFLPHYNDEHPPQVDLRFDSISDAEQWAARLGASDAHVSHLARVTSYSASAEWMGHEVLIAGHDVADAGGVR